MQYRPENGWSAFQQSDEVVELIATSLILEENRGIWQYFNFDDENLKEHASIWCSSETSATNQVNLTFSSDAQDAKIRSLGIEMTNNASVHFKQLLLLKKKLKNQFGIRPI